MLVLLGYLIPAPLFLLLRRRRLHRFQERIEVAARNASHYGNDDKEDDVLKLPTWRLYATVS